MNTANYALLFDLDGTLIDSAGDLQTATNAILDQEGFAPLNRAAIETCLGDGLRLLLIKAFKLAGEDLDNDDLSQLMPDFMKIYAAIEPQPSCVYPGVLDFLKAQQARGVKLGLCTNKYESATLRILKTLDLEKYFSAIIGGDTVSECKPHPLPLQHALYQLDAMPQNAVMLGDHANDILAARGAGMKVIGAQYGYSHAWPANAAPDAFVKSFAEYAALLPKMLNGF
jgi:phosphoglycolate phosphatase